MNSLISNNISLPASLRRLFGSKNTGRTVLEADDARVRGISHTEFLGYTIKYPQPVMPSKITPTKHLIRMFGIKRHTASFRKLTTAAHNTFKN